MTKRFGVPDNEYDDGNALVGVFFALVFSAILAGACALAYVTIKLF